MDQYSTLWWVALGILIGETLAAISLELAALTFVLSVSGLIGVRIVDWFLPIPKGTD